MPSTPVECSAQQFKYTGSNVRGYRGCQAVTTCQSPCYKLVTRAYYLPVVCDEFELVYKLVVAGTASAMLVIADMSGKLFVLLYLDG